MCNPASGFGEGKHEREKGEETKEAAEERERQGWRQKVDLASGFGEEVYYAKGHNQTANCRPRLRVYETEQGEDLFFHRSRLEGVDYNSLREGQQVEFEVGQGPHGSCADKVRLGQPKGEEHQAQPSGSGNS